MKKSSITNATQTRRKLLDAAAELFAEHGIRGVSVRQIATAAGVNQALVSYHFGGKEALFEEVVRASASGHVADRMQQLTQARARHEASNESIGLEDLLRIYLEPLINKEVWASENSRFVRLHGVMMAERADGAEEIASRAFNSVNIAFIDEICKCLSHLSRDVVIWRFYALIGSVLFMETHPAPPGLMTISGGQCDPTDSAEVLRQLIPFFVAGLTADAPLTEAQETRTSAA